MASTYVTQTKLKCITIAQPQPKAETVCPEVTGVDGGTKKQQTGSVAQIH